MGVKNLLLCAVGAALLVGGSAAAAPSGANAVTITSAKVTAKWHESFLPKGKRKVTFSFTTTEAATYEASVRGVAKGNLVAVKRFSVGAGTFTRSIELSPRPVPGAYTLRLKQTPTGAGADFPVVIPAPQEGVVDRAYFSRTQTGPRVKVFRGRTSTIIVHFHFVARPQARKVSFIWKKPGNPKVRFTGRATKPYKQTVSSFVCAKYIGHKCGGGQLRTGKWYAILKAAGRVTKRQLVVVA
jgi:hypothetical protein